MIRALCLMLLGGLLGGSVTAVGQEAATPKPQVFLRLKHSASHGLVKTPGMLTGERMYDLLELAVIRADGFVLLQGDVNVSSPLKIVADSKGTSALKGKLQLETGFYPLKFRSGKPEVYMLRIQGLAGIDFAQDGLHVAGTLPLRRILSRKKVEIRPLGELKERVFEYPGGFCRISREGNAVIIRSDCWPEPRFCAEDGQGIAESRHAYLGGIGAHQSYAFEIFPEKGALVLELPEKVESAPYDFDFANLPVKTAFDQAAEEISMDPSCIANMRERLARYKQAPLLEGATAKVVFGNYDCEFLFWAQEAERGVSGKSGPNLTLQIEVTPGEKAEQKFKNLVYFIPTSLCDDTGKDLSSDQLVVQRVLFMDNNVPRMRVNLAHLSLPAPGAKTIAVLNGEVYCNDMAGNPRRISLSMSDIPLVPQE